MATSYNKRRAAVSLPNFLIGPVADGDMSGWDRRQAADVYPIGAGPTPGCVWLVTQRNEIMNEIDGITTTVDGINTTVDIHTTNLTELMTEMDSLTKTVRFIRTVIDGKAI